ncbi:MAG: hypothetical protein ACSLFB_00235 [Acidimicrobiales bacterium]
MNGDLMMAFVSVLIAVVVLWRGWRRVESDFVSRWKERFNVDVPPDERSFVVERLERGRRVRAICVAVGLVIAGLPTYMNLIDPALSGSFANPLVGHAWLFAATLGALYAEVLVIQRPRYRKASLVERRSRDYVDQRFVTAVHALGGSTLALAALATALEWWNWEEAWIGVGASAVAVASVHFGVRAILERPAIAVDGAMQDLDDALRSDGAFRIVGAAVALAASGLTTIGIGNAQGMLAIPSLLFGLLAYIGLGLWWTLARDVKWSVRQARSVP